MIDIDERLLDALEELGFEGLDASAAENLIAYCGMRHTATGVTLLTDVARWREDEPVRCHAMLLHISDKEIADRVRDAGAGFHEYMDSSLALPDGMAAIQGLRQYNGGFHENSSQWRALEEMDIANLISRIRSMCALTPVRSEGEWLKLRLEVEVLYLTGGERHATLQDSLKAIIEAAHRDGWLTPLNNAQVVSVKAHVSTIPHQQR